MKVPPSINGTSVACNFAATSAMQNPSHFTDSQSVKKVKLLVLRCQIKDNSFKALVDSGATHNFVSQNVVTALRCTTKPSSLTARLADNRAAEIYELVHPLTLQFEGFTTTSHFLVMDPLSYDILLGKAWLDQYEPQIHWSHNLCKLTTDSAIQTSTCEPDQLTRGTEDVHTDEVEKQVIVIKQEFADVFTEANKLPPKRAVDHAITLTDHSKTPNSPPFPLSIADQTELRTQLDSWLEQGKVRPSNSPFGCGVFTVPKPGGKKRVVFDYRHLNAITRKDVYPLPRIEDLLNQTQGAKYFSKIDLQSGYHQIRIKSGDQHKTAFRTRYGLYEWTVMPFGLCNAPSTFQRLMNDIFRKEIDKHIIVYIDDILIYSKTWKEHIHHVRKTLQTLRQHKLYAHPNKCSFFIREVNFLGYKLGANSTLHVNDDKVKKLREMLEPTTSKQVQRFLGLCNWFRRFIPHYGSTAAPLYKCTTHFEWEAPQKEAFHILKEAVTCAPVLRIADYTKPFEVFCDASDAGIGAVLMQDGHPLAYESKKFSPAEINYSTMEKELLAVIHALKKWRIYLDGGNPFIVYTDNMAVSFLHSKQTLSRREARWLDLLSEFNLVIKHRPGEHNEVADTLSRLNAIEAEPLNDIQELIIANYEKDKWTKSLLAELQRGLTTDHSVNKYMLVNKLIRVKLTNRIVVPRNTKCITLILHDSHDAVTAAHPGAIAMYNSLKSTYYWPRMFDTIKRYVLSCNVCAQIKHNQQKQAGKTKPVQVPSLPWQHMSCDFITHLPKSKLGNDSILVVVDSFTKRAHFLPTQDTATAFDIAHLFYREVFRLHGVPEKLLSDRDARFTSEFWKTLHELLGTKLAMSTAHHPRTDGQTEILNKTLETMIRAYINKPMDNWESLLPALEFAYNSRVHTATGFTPFLLDTGSQPRSFATLKLDVEPHSAGAEDYVLQHKLNLQAARDSLEYSKDLIAFNADYKRRHDNFQVGEWVYLFAKHLRFENLSSTGTQHKFNFKFVGPFQIEKVLSHTNVELKLPAAWKMHRVFHIEMLRKKHEIDKTETPDRVQQATELPRIDSKTKEFEVEKILDKKGSGRTLKYRVRWVGYSPDEDTWEPLSHLKNAKEEIQDYELSLKKGEKSQPDMVVPTKSTPDTTNGNTEPQRRSSRSRKPVEKYTPSVQTLVLEVPKSLRRDKTSTQLRKLALRQRVFSQETPHLIC